MKTDWEFQFALEKLLFEQLPGLVLSATDGHTQIDKSYFFQNGDEYIGEFENIVEAIGKLHQDRLAELNGDSPEKNNN